MTARTTVHRLEVATELYRFLEDQVLPGVGPGQPEPGRVGAPAAAQPDQGGHVGVQLGRRRPGR
ncbi:MAG: hypothetical protein ACJ8GO_18260, partial [Ramlibacter sp.]